MPAVLASSRSLLRQKRPARNLRLLTVTIAEERRAEGLNDCIWVTEAAVLTILCKAF